MSDAYVPNPAVVRPREYVRPRSRFADLAAPRWFPAAAAGAGLVTAALAIGHRPGIGLTLAVVTAWLAALPAMRVARADWPLAALALALGVMPSLRDAEWLVALDVLAILALFTLVAVGVRDWRSIVVAAVSVPARAVPAPGFLFRALPRGGGLAPALRGASLAGALVLAFGALFSSADAVFGELTGRLVPDAGPLPGRFVVFALVTVLLGAAVLANAVPPELPAPAEPRRVTRVEWLVPLVAVNAVFAAFVGVQLAVLFGGREHVVRTAGLTYAEYARSGFFQLLVVTALTFGVVAGAVRWAPATRLPRALVGLLCLLNGVVLVSALRRLGLYEQAFGLSIDRVLARTIALWLGTVLVLVVVAGLTGRAAWLPRAVVGTAAAALLALNLANPDARVAASLVDRYERTGDIDTYYLSGLGADAVPAIMRLPGDVRRCALAGQTLDGDPWAAANASRARARALLGDVSTVPYGTCDPGY